MPKWTVMVFMGVSSVEGNVPLEAAAAADLLEMEAIGSGDGLNIYVEKHDDNGLSRYHIGHPGGSFDTNKTLKNQEGQRPLDDSALITFVNDALIAANHQARDYSMLVLWGHTYDFAFGRQRNRDGTIDALDFGELRDRLLAFQKKWGGGKLDIIGFDSCEASTVEMACQLNRFADYLLSSEVGIPVPGWPYDRILDRLKNPMGRLMGPAELGSYIVRRFCESYEAKDDAVSLTLLRLDQAEELAARVGWLAQKLAIAIGDDERLALLLDLFWRSQTEPGRPYVDVGDLCLNLARESNDGAIIEAATALGDFLFSPKGDVVKTSQKGEGCPLIVEHGRNAGSLARVNGISLYAPHLAPEKDPSVAERLYDKFILTKVNLWRDLVHALARS